MHTRTAPYLRKLPPWASLAIWFATLLSPTAYVLAVICLSRLQLAAPPAWFVVGLSCVIPVAALIVCSTVAWLSQTRRSWRVGWLVLTIAAIPLQVGMLVVIIVSAITAAISLP